MTTNPSESTYTYIFSCLHQLFADTGCSLEDLPGAMDDKDRWSERFREIRDDIYMYIYR